jgi:L-threonylcarbamoyladenylate synthase
MTTSDLATGVPSVEGGHSAPWSVDLEGARARLLEGGIVAHPTETVYGLGCLLRPASLDALADAKGREISLRPFLILAPNLAWVRQRFRWGRVEDTLASRFWPGPLTLVLRPEGGSVMPAAVTSEIGEIAVRLSSHPLTSALLESMGEAMTSTSANRPGDPPARTGEAAAHAVVGLGLPDAVVLDGGALPPSPPSTVVRVSSVGIELIRKGATPLGDVHAALGEGGAE